MKRLHASKHRFKRIIHISIRGSTGVPSTKRNQISISSHRTSKLSQAQTSHLTFNSNTISNYSNHVILTLV